MATEMMVYTGGALMCNGYLVRGTGGEWLAVDAPAGFAAWAQSRLPEGARLTHLLLTHQHFDHIQDAAALHRATGCSIHAASPYTPELTLAQNARQWGIAPPEEFAVDAPAGGGDTRADWGGLRWEILHIPGHSRDSLVYVLPEEGELFSGDVLFAGSIGRSDFPGGSSADLTRGIRSKILPLPPQMRVHPGHGPSTTVGDEELNNPFLQG